MDKFFVTEITKTTDSEAFATLITIKDVYDEAEALYHQILASALVNPNIEYALVKIDNVQGNCKLLRVIDHRPIPEPEEPVEPIPVEEPVEE